MQNETQVSLAHRIFKLLDLRTTELASAPYRNPVSTYTDDAHLAAERNTLFLQRPQIFTFSCRMPRPGDYISHDLNGVPIMVVRDGGGTARAFLNVCRHRGARLVEGCGSGKSALTCPYHSWTYDLTGKLRAMVPAFGFEGLNKEDHGLTSLPCAEKDGLIWVRPTPGGAIDPDAYLQGLAPEFRAYGLEGYFHYESRVLSKDVNWKLVIDTFLETWHVSTLHKETVAPIFIASASNVFDAFGEHGRMMIPRRSFMGLKDQAETEWDLLRHSAIVYLIFPHTLVNWQGDHVEVWRPFPGDRPNKVTMEVSFYVPEEPLTDKARHHWERNMDILMRTVNEEDFHVCAGIQKGFNSGAQQHVTIGRNEPGLAHFHRTLHGALHPKEMP